MSARRRRSAAARLRPFWVVFVLVAAVAAALGYFGATWRGFDPRSVSVRGNAVVPRAEIIERAGIDMHRNLWLQDMHAASARVEAIPLIGAVSIARRLPGNAVISVTERRPFANVVNGASSAVVDTQLRVLRRGKDVRLVQLILPGDGPLQPGAFLRSVAAERLRDDARSLLAAHVDVQALQLDRYDDLVARLKNGVVLLLGGDDDLQKKIPLIAPILAQVGLAGRPIAAIDLRAPSTPVVRYKN